MTGEELQRLRRLVADKHPPKGFYSWGDKQERCDHCCNKDGCDCDEHPHYDRGGRPGCPYCLNTGWALWNPIFQEDYYEEI